MTNASHTARIEELFDGAVGLAEHEVVVLVNAARQRVFERQHAEPDPSPANRREHVAKLRTRHGLGVSPKKRPGRPLAVSAVIPLERHLRHAPPPRLWPLAPREKS